MENVEMLKELLAYNIWADRKILKSLEEQSEPNPRSLIIFNHLLVAEAEWLTRLIDNKGTPDFNFWPNMSLSDCKIKANEIHEKYTELINNLTEKKLGVVAVYKNSKGVEYRTSWREVLMHVTIHSAYHRGQVAMALRDSGDTPVNTDYVGFIRERVSAV
jgi:uncharacterized damage-inducible protein DinB